MTVSSVWENKSMYIYYTELTFELSALAVDFAHHLHMLVRLSWQNFLSKLIAIASDIVVLFMAYTISTIITIYPQPLYIW